QRMEPVSVNFFGSRESDFQICGGRQNGFASDAMLIEFGELCEAQVQLPPMCPGLGGGTETVTGPANLLILSVPTSTAARAFLAGLRGLQPVTLALPSVKRQFD